MSRFSGKFDFCDEIDIKGLDRILRCDVYCNGQRLELKTRRDCIPYYPHIIACSAWDNERRCGSITLSGKSWVDIEEERYGHMKIHDFYREALRKEMEATE